MRKKVGRKKGRRTKGYFYRSGRGWYSKDRGRFVPLRFDDGQHIKDANIDEGLVQEAHARLLLHRQGRPKIVRDISVLEVCQAYLTQAKDTGAAKTFSDRADTLFDFCFGLPPAYRSKDGSRVKRLVAEKKLEMAKKRIHKGYGRLLASEMRPLDIDQWLRAHTQWTSGGRRTRVQAVKRAFNYAVEAGLISKNPIRGYKPPTATARVTYVTPAQETALLQSASPALVTAIRVCIRTGARPGAEFAALTSKHVVDHGDRMNGSSSRPRPRRGSCGSSASPMRKSSRSLASR